MEKIKTDIISARALNASRKLHLPTYVATRFLLETVAGNKDSSWIYETLPRKYLIQDKLQYYKSLKFKKVDENDFPVYREFIVPGPTAVLVESILLGYLSQSEKFKKSDRVYSYIWPSSLKCPHNFEHYISGYRKRNDDIAEYLSQNGNKIIIVSDIEKFYPSIAQDKVKERFNDKLNTSDIPNDIKELANKLLNDLFSFFPSGVGITTGSEFSHVIGDIALLNIDNVLSEKYGAGYYRYVDDIILIVNPEEKHDAIKLLESLANDEGLSINSEKNDVLTSDSWLKYGPHNEHKVQTDSFEAFLFKVKTYLQINPESQTNIEALLNHADFSIPISRLSSASKSSGFVKKLVGFIKMGWGVALKAAIANDEDILKQALVVRKKVHTELLKYIESDIPEGATLRKWYLQRLRYLTNRAVYLFPHSELGFLLPKLEQIPEFVDTVALLKTLINGDYSELLNMPGSALAACAGLLKQTDRKLTDISISSETSPAHIESSAIFALWDVANLTYANVPLQNNRVIDYLKFSSGIPGYERDIDGFNYIDSVTSLGIHKNKNDYLRVLESRFSDAEASVLDALDIGWNSEY